MANLESVYIPGSDDWRPILVRDLPTAAIFEAWRMAFSHAMSESIVYGSDLERKFLADMAKTRNFKIVGAAAAILSREDEGPEDYLLLCTSGPPALRYHLSGMWVPRGLESRACGWLDEKSDEPSGFASRLSGLDPSDTRYGEVFKGYIAILESLYPADEISEILLRAL